MRQVVRKSTDGFTLVELVMVLAIMGLVAALAAPRHANALNSYRVDAAARRISADLALVQAKARATGSARAIQFNRLANTYTLPGELSLNKPGSPYLIDLSIDPYRVSISTVNFSGSATLSFNGFGVPTNPGFVQIRSGTLTRNITVEPLSGTATVQ